MYYLCSNSICTSDIKRVSAFSNSTKWKKNMVSENGRVVKNGGPFHQTVLR